MIGSVSTYAPSDFLLAPCCEDIQLGEVNAISNHEFDVPEPWGDILIFIAVGCVCSSSVFTLTEGRYPYRWKKLHVRHSLTQNYACSRGFWRNNRFNIDIPT